LARAGLPDSRTRPSGHSVSNHLCTLRLVRARYPSTDRTEIASPQGISPRELGASPLASRLATPHRPNRVSYRTDWPFTSCCSPPRVATTQLQAITSYVDLERTFTPPTRCALRRTSAGVPPAVTRASCPCPPAPCAALPAIRDEMSPSRDPSMSSVLPLSSSPAGATRRLVPSFRSLSSIPTLRSMERSRAASWRSIILHVSPSGARQASRSIATLSSFSKDIVPPGTGCRDSEERTSPRVRLFTRVGYHTCGVLSREICSRAKARSSPIDSSGHRVIEEQLKGKADDE